MEASDSNGATARAVAPGQEGAPWTIEIAGELDLFGVPLVQSCLDEILEYEPKQLVVDLGRVSFVDSMGVSLLLAARRRVASIELRSLQPAVLKALQVMGLDQVLHIVP